MGEHIGHTLRSFQLRTRAAEEKVFVQKHTEMEFKIGLKHIFLLCLPWKMSSDYTIEINKAMGWHVKTA